MPPSPPDVPEVDYIDWKQMIDVVYKTKARFVDAMEAAVMTDAAVYDALRENTAPATTLHSFRDPIYHDAAICYFEAKLGKSSLISRSTSQARGLGSSQTVCSSASCAFHASTETSSCTTTPTNLHTTFCP